MATIATAPRFILFVGTVIEAAATAAGRMASGKSAADVRSFAFLQSIKFLWGKKTENRLNITISLS